MCTALSMVCSGCLDPDCPKGANASAECINKEFLPDDKERSAVGHYTLDFRSRMPASAHSLPNQLIDAQVGHVNAESPLRPFSKECATFVAKADFLDRILAKEALTISHAVCIYRNIPVHRESITQRLEDLAIITSDETESNRLKVAIIATQRVAEETRRALPKAANTARELEYKHYPLTVILFQISTYHQTRINVSSMSISPGEFDESTGAVKTSFSTIKKVYCPEMKNRIFRDFFEVMSLLKGGGGRAQWRPLLDELDTLSEAGNTPEFVHLLLFQCLKKIDSSPSINIVIFMMQHWVLCFSAFQTKYLTENAKSHVRPRHETNTSGDKEDKASKERVQKERTSIPVTKQGEWVENPFKRTYDGNKLAYCNRWNANRPCNVGCPSGPDKGKCIFVHHCSWCNSADHYGAEKSPNAPFPFVCPKHGG